MLTTANIGHGYFGDYYIFLSIFSVWKRLNEEEEIEKGKSFQSKYNVCTHYFSLHSQM